MAGGRTDVSVDQAYPTNEVELSDLLRGHSLSARLEMMLSSTRLGTMTIGEYYNDPGAIVAWMLRQRNCGRKTVTELTRILRSHSPTPLSLPPNTPDPPLAEVALHELLAADELSARLLEAMRTTELLTMSLPDYMKQRAQLESRLLRLPNMGRKSVAELRGLVGMHIRQDMERQGLNPSEFGEAFAAFVAAAPTSAPEFAGPPADCDLAALLKWHLQRLPERTADILTLRFGLNGERPLTLQDIGDRYEITRERIRQIEAKGLKSLRAACRRFPVRPLLEASTPAILDQVFSGRRHATAAQAERGIASIDGWSELALCLVHGGAFSWLASAATKFADGWLDLSMDSSDVIAVADRLRRRSAGRPFPRAADELNVDADPALVAAAMELSLRWRVEAGYVFERRPGPRLRRTAILHTLLSNVGSPLEMVPLLRRYHAAVPNDRCTDRDLALVMEAASHLFVEIYEGCWTAIGSAAPHQLPGETDGQESESTTPLAEQNEGTIATALERELERVGPCRMGELMERAIDILPEGRSRNSVGPTLLSNPTRFVRVLPGVYALPHQVLDGRDLIHTGTAQYLLNQTQARFYAIGRKSGEQWQAYPLWTPTAEMRLCRWARAGDDRSLYRSLLDIASIDDWPTDAPDKNAWRELRLREGRFELWSEPRLSGGRPPLDRVFAAAIRLAGRGSIGWVAANRILGYMPSSYAGAGLLAGMVSAGMAVQPAASFGWQLPHEPGHSLAYWVARLTDALHESGIIDWDAGVGAELAPLFAAPTVGCEVLIEEPEEMDEYEQILAEHRRSLHARRLEARLELQTE